MKVLLNHPVRELDIRGPKRVKDLLKELALLPESVLVVRGDDLVTEDDTLRDTDRVEIRPVMSGGRGKGSVGEPIAPQLQWVNDPGAGVMKDTKETEKTIPAASNNHQAFGSSKLCLAGGMGIINALP